MIRWRRARCKAGSMLKKPRPWEFPNHKHETRQRPGLCPRCCRQVAAPNALRSDLQRVNELIPGFEASNWYGLYAPKNTPATVVARLNEEINVGLADPRLKARFADLGGVPAAGRAAEFGRLVASETEKWGK